MKRLFLAVLIASASISFMGCSNNNNNGLNNNTNNNSNVVDNKDTNDNKNNTDNKNDINDNKDNTTNNNSNDKNSNKDDVSDKDDKVTEKTFQLVTKDIDYNVVKGKEIKSTDSEIDENIDDILDAISVEYFDGNSLDLETIETVDNKKIAVIDLEGDADYWNQRMQGSAGGLITEYTLIENVLQKDYAGDWIDGVRFTLNEKPLQGSDHAPGLAETTYR